MAKEEHLIGKPIAHACAAWGAFFALYLLFTGTGAPAELAVGGAAALFAAAFEAVLRTRSERPLGLTVRMLRPLIPALGQLVLDSFRVAAALLAAFRALPPGGFHETPAPAGADLGSPAGQGIATAAISLAPNSFVVSNGPEGGCFAVHRLTG